MKRFLPAAFALTLLTSPAAAGDIGFVEDFALARDRAEALKKLIPGTEDWYYYHALHYLNTEQYDKAADLTRPWHQRYGQTARLTEIQTRHALLIYDKDPKKSLDYLRGRLGLHFDHQKATPGGAPNLPTALDPKLIARATLKTDSLARWGNLDNFEDAALDWLAADKLDWEKRRALLARLQRPDVPDLPALVAEDLKAQNPPEFGAFAVHKQMTLPQLEELLKLRPNLLNNTAYVQASIAKLHPGADEDWRHDPARALAYLDRLLAFARRLPPRENGFKAHVLYHRLQLDRARGVYDKELFLEYLKLPRHQPYMARGLNESPESQRFPADLGANLTPVTLLPVVGPDELLVRSDLTHFLLTADSTKEFEPFVDDVYLKHLFAEVKITNGLGEPERWATLLPPELFSQLKERVDIDFAPTNKTAFAADEPVRLELHVKNVSTLIVKVFEINTVNYYRTHGKEVDTDVNLDGLVANAEQTHAYPDPPLRRVGRQFEFPQLNKPGVYVIDFIGGGKSSRALVRKGRLRPLVVNGTAGQKVTVVDDRGQQVKDAAVWLGGQEFRADPDGTVIVPYSTSPGRRPVVLSRGDFASLDHLDHQPEAYHLAAGLHIDRESLLTRKVATILVRPGLTLNGTPVSVKLLEELKLRITATDLDGIATSTEVPDFKLFEDRESVHEFRVPPRLASLNVTLTAKVKSLSQGKPVDVAAGETFGLNGIARTDKVEDLHLAKFGAEYVVELLGRTGEARPDRPVQVAVKHRDFKEPVRVTLKSDVQGRVRLGQLVDIVTVTATGPEGTEHTWTLPTDQHTYRQAIHARAGEVVALPYLGTSPDPSREELALFELRGGGIAFDSFNALAVKDGLLELRGLAPGDYDLWLKRTGERIRVRIAAGPVVGGHVLSSVRTLQLPGLKPVQIASVGMTDAAVTVKLKDYSPFTRVHVFATRYRPAYSPYAHLGGVRPNELQGSFPAHAESVYLTGRNIGDEYRYVLDRRYQKKYPGNMLDRPALLLNPWAVRSTEAGEQLAKGGEAFGGVGGAVPSTSVPGGGYGGIGAPPPVPGGDFADLDFLAVASAALVNLVPDKDGVVTVARKDVGPHAWVHVVAVDPLHTTYRSTALPEQPASYLDLRLRAGLDPAGHFSLQKQVTMLSANKPFVLEDAASGRFEAYDSLPRVYALYSTLSHDPKLAEFAFVLTWPTLKPEEKRALYSKYACHELNYFLLKKDPEFFNAVVKPHLANKKDKTFLDHFLLGDDLGEYAQPWRYGRLNTVERVLLAQRLPDEPAKAARHLSDLFRLLPPAGDRTRLLFETAVKGRALAIRSETGLEERKGKDTKMLDPEAKPKADEPAKPGESAPAPPAGAGVPGGFAGERPVPAKEAPDADEKRAGGKAQSRDGSTRDLSKQLAQQQKEQKEELRELNKVEMFFDDDRAKKVAKVLYRRIDPTQEWAENNYYHLPIPQQVAALVPVSGFWLDYAKHDGKTPFLSASLADASRNFTEMMFALAVLDLPFASGKPDVRFDGNRMTYTPTGAAVAFHEEVRPATVADNRPPVLVSQNFYRHGDRYRDENGERFDKFVTGEFVVHTVYGCQVIVTNPTSSRQRLTVLVQTPVGSVPLAGWQQTKAVPVDLEPYRTHVIDFLFYFPRPGKFAHFPAHVAKTGAFVAAAQPVTFDVVAKPTKADTESWEYVSQNGTAEQVLAYLGRENVAALDLEKIAFRMRDRDFFASVIRLLLDRHTFHPTLWSYGLFHNDPAVAREFLLHAEQIVAETGGPITSPLLTVDPVARHQYEHLEYKPLVNARAHSLGQRRQIVNARVLEQYHRFMKLLGYRPRLSDDDELAVVYYLLLQDRVEEALTTFARVNSEKLATKMQYDYCAAYLALYTEELPKARSIAARYAGQPVDRWRNAFVSITNQIDEAEGKGAQVADATNQAQTQAQLAAKEPSFEFTVDAKAMQLTWQNVDAVTVNYYLMDVELLFSRNPFVQQSGGQFASIRPNATRQLKLPANQAKLAVPLPEELLKRNVLVEVSAAGKTRAKPYYATAMAVQTTENYGHLRVTDGASAKPLPKAYVKVYARLADGQVKFHKDGYTDVRGRFDYATVSTPERTPVERFAVLVLSDEHGAEIREVAPPQQ